MELNLNIQKMVKNVLLLTILSFSALFNLNGQIQKKTLMTGGDLDLFLEANDPIGYSFLLKPNISYFFVENLALGLQFETEYTKRGDDSYSSIGLGPMVRYYRGNDILSVFGHFSYLARLTSQSNIDETNYSHLFLPGVGLNYMLTPSVGLETMLGLYLGSSNPTFSLGFGFQIFIPPTIN